MAAGVAGLTGVVGLAALGGVAARDQKSGGQERTADTQPAAAPKQDAGGPADKGGDSAEPAGAWAGDKGAQERGGKEPARPVPCDSDKLIQAIAYANANHGGALDLAKGCTYELTRSDDGNGLPVIRQSISLRGDDTKITRAANAAPFRILNVGRDGHLTLKNVTIKGGQTAADLVGAEAPVVPSGKPAGAVGSAAKPAPKAATAAKPPANAGTTAKPPAKPAATAKPPANAGTTAKPPAKPAATAKPPANAGTTAKPAATAQPTAAAKPAASAKPAAAAKPAATKAAKAAKPAAAADAVSTLADAGPSDGAGLLVQRGGRADVEHSQLVLNSSGGHGGAIANYGTTRIAQSRVETSSAAGIGGGVFNAGVLRVENSKITSNSADNGGGIGNGAPTMLRPASGGTVWVWQSTISRNRALGAAGGVFDYEGTTTLSNSEVVDNDAGTDGGGLAIFGDSQLSLERVVVAGNTAGQTSGGLSVAAGATAVIEHSNVKENVAELYGGGLSDFGGTVVLRNTEIVANRAVAQSSVAGGIANLGGEVRLERSKVAHNFANLAPGGIFTTNDGVQISRDSAVTGNRPTNCVGSTVVPTRCFG
ncbi:right-handed parallel beta-helix repeat-containing protein [Micromonospora radicis]|uniref:Right-handed parallel beta-helix repeat-containing protein n=1 Tax=Micromonospora radicis TaxID=1894971 RepID=A0A418MY40_9ACTN|nr:right-handed parallel beta-helix repeat-containing protein [Micromonospora radicis]